MRAPSEPAGADHLGHLLWEASSRYLVFSEPDLAVTQLSPTSIGVLEHIADLPGITASELGRIGFKTQQATSQVTSRLERLGYVERRVGAGRGVGLYVTKTGEQALAEGLALEQAVERRLKDLLGAERYEELRALLQQTRKLLTDATAE